MPRQGHTSLSSKMRKKRAAARAAAAAAAPPPEPDPEPASTVFNPAPAPMPSASAAQLPADIPEWDASALNLLKKLGKRDATTRLRALSELDSAVREAPEGAGGPFLARFAEVFSALVADGHPRARCGALHIAAASAQRFRALCKNALPELAPHWIAACADPAASVSAAARDSIVAAFPAERQRARFAEFVAPALREFCFAEFAALSTDSASTFADRAARIGAVVAWPAHKDVGRPELMAEFVDDFSRPLHAIAVDMPSAKNKLCAPGPVCRAAVALLSATDPATATEAQQYRAEQFGEIALASLPVEPAAWDLLLVLFAGGWGTQAFGDELPGLREALVEAVRSRTVSAPLDALLPLFAALPGPSAAAAQAAEAVLLALRDMLGLRDEDDEREMQSASVSEALRILPAYLECTRYVYLKGARKWIPDDFDALLVRIGTRHLASVLRALISGTLVPCAKRPVTASRSASSRRPAFAPVDLAAHALEKLASALSALEDVTAPSAPAGAAVVLLAELRAGTQDESRLGARYALLLKGIIGSMCAQTLARDVVMQTISPVDAAPEEPEAKQSAQSPALLQALADSVAMVPGLDGDDSVVLKEKCVMYAVEHAEENPAAAGAVLAWASYPSDVLATDKDAPGEVARLLSDAFEDQAILYRTMAAMIEAHAISRPDGELSTGGSAWAPIAGPGMETLCARTARDVQLLAPASGAAVGLLAAMLRAGGGASVSDVSFRAALVSISDCVRKGDRIVGPVVAAVLNAPVDEHERLSCVVAFVGTVIVWGSSEVAAVAVAFMQGVEESTRNLYATTVLDELEGAVLRPGAELEGLVTRWNKAVEAMCGDVPQSLVSTHAVLLDRFGDAAKNSIGFPSSFLAAIVQHIPLEKLYGGLDVTKFDAPRFLDSYGVLSIRPATMDDDSCEQMEEHIDSLSSAFRADLVTEAIKRTFRDRDRLLLRIIARTTTTSTARSRDDEMLTENAVSVLLKDTFQEQKSGELDTKICVLAVEVLEICTACTKRDALGCFREILELASSAIRRDANSKLAQFGVMLLSASLVSNGDPSLADLPSWLVELVNTALRAIRRYHETMSRIPMASKKGKKGTMSSSPLGAGAVLMSRAIEALDEGMLNTDEWRFWALAVQDALLDAQYVDSRRATNQCTVANLGVLAVSLVQADEDGLAPQKIDCDDICRRGAWTAVNFLPALNDGETYELLPANPSGLAGLAVMAAERGSLVSHKEGLSLSRDKVYALVPLLASTRSDVRRAALVILVHAASVDLPRVVEQEYPENGFSDERKEIRAVRNMIPEPIRVGLVWPKVAAGSSSAEIAGGGGGDAVSFKELGYFLSWRLFLELVTHHGSDAHVGMNGEDLSFRRIGISYLRSNEELFEQFFARCVNIVIYGTLVEKDAAASSATQILSSASIASKLQGIQLAKAQAQHSKRISKVPNNGESADDTTVSAVQLTEREMLEHEVGAAAGAAFARALQRLPALSRRLGTGRLGHAVARATEAFVEERISPLLAAAEIERVRAWGAFGGGGEGSLRARGSVAGREVAATYTFSDVTLEICLQLPAAFPLQVVTVEAGNRKGMSEARWRKTLLGMTTLLRNKDGSLVEAVELWRRNLDKTFQGLEECPICYSVLHLSSAALPKMQCRTCKNMFHSECLCKWFNKSNSSACPLCRSAF